MGRITAPEARWLDRTLTAEYISVKEAELSRMVKAGRIPSPSYHLGPKKPRWDRLALDACFVHSVASTDPDTAVEAYVQQILAGPTRRRRREQDRPQEAGRRNG
jgi:hypothetical protein